MAKIKISCFDGKGDFSMWKKRMLAHLSILGLKEALTDSSPTSGSEVTIKKGEEEEDFKERLKALEVEKAEKAEKAMNMIILNLGDHVLRKLEDCTTAASIWTALERLYNSKTLPNRIHLQHKFYTFKMLESKSIDENIDDFLKLVSGLSSVNVSVSEEVQAILLLSSLPAQYNQLKETLKYGRETLTIEDVTNAAKSKEIELKEVKEEASTSQRSGDAYVARGRPERRDGYKGKNFKNKSRSRSRTKLTCWYCKKEGHIKKDCYARKKRMESGDDDGEAAVMIDELQEVDALAISDQNPREKWVIDSGCSYHMTSRREWFVEFSEVAGGQVLLADDRAVSVQGIGTIRINANGGTVKCLTNVRYIPNLKRNLISVSSLDMQGFRQEGGNGKTCFFKNEKLALQGTLCGSLYLLDGYTLEPTAYAAVSKDDTALWHSRLAHTSIRNLKVLVEKGILDRKKISDLEFCESCVMGKNKRLKFNIGKHNSKEVLRYVHSDLWGSPNVHLSLSRKQYFLSMIDDFSRKVWVYFLATKDEAFSKFCEWKGLVENQVNEKVKCLRTDNGLEFCNIAFNDFCKQHGIERHRTCSYTPQQSGVAERMNRTIMEKVRCLLDESGLEEKFWAEAVATSVYIINRTPSSAIDFNIPEELWLGRTPGYDHLRRFGTVVYVHINQGKLKPRALKGVFIGYPSGVKDYKVWLIEEKKCVISRNAVFREDQLYRHVVKNTGSEKNQRHPDSQNSVRSSVEIGEASGTASEGQTEGGVDVSESTDETQTAEEVEDLSNYQLARDRVRREIVKPSRFTDESEVAFALSVAAVIDAEEPRNFEEAMRSKDWKKWSAGMDDEMSSLEKNKTWALTDLPKDKKAIGCKWIYKWKPGIPGVEEPRHKSRLVAKGYSQQEGIDYQEIFSPVVKHVSIRLMLSIVVDRDLEMEQLDVKTAFLHGVIDEDIYMEQPEGYVVKGQEGKVCKLLKSLYGLKQAPRQWNKCFDQVMIKHGFVKSEYDLCVYLKKLSYCEYVYLLIYVDDMLLVAKSMDDINEVKEMLGREFDMKDLGPAKRILGMDIERDRAGGVLKLSQSRYVKKVLQVFRMADSKSVTTPIGAQFKLTALEEGEQGLGSSDEECPYANAVGSIMYAMISTRPDLAFGVGLVSRFMSNPSKEHWEAVKWILRYLVGTKDVGLVFKKNSGNFSVKGYSDSDFGGDLDRRRSTTGYVFQVGGNTVSWKSGLQQVVALSTTEAEYISLVEAIKEGLWLRGITEELGYAQSEVVVGCDSQSAICLAKNNVFHDRTKHVAVSKHVALKMSFVRDMVEGGEVSIQKVHTSKNPADMLTKVIPSNKFEQALVDLGVADC